MDKTAWDEIEKLAQILKLISNKNRLAIIAILFKRKLAVCQIANILNLKHAVASSYLKKLELIDIVKSEKNYKFVFYSLKENKIINDIAQKLAKNLNQNEIELKAREALENCAIY